MRIKEDQDGGLILDGNLDEEIGQAFACGRYVEAFALLHAQIDWWMASLYRTYRWEKGLITKKKRESNVDEKRYVYMESAKFLCEKGIIDSRTYGKLTNFNDLRDKIIHRLVIRSYRPRNRENKVTRKEAEGGFESGKTLAKLLISKTNQLLTNRPETTR